MNLTENTSRNLIANWSRVTQLVREIQELLGDFVTPDANSRTQDPPTPTDAIAERVADLAAHLRSLFTTEETSGYLSNLDEVAPHLADNLFQVRNQHTNLTRTLDEIFDLAGSPLRPGSSPADIKSRFDAFVKALRRHEQFEETLLQHALLDEVGVMD